jgi:hypothetical protein
MNEYMLLIRNKTDAINTISEKEKTHFLKACEYYIGKLKEDKKLLSAQPLARNGLILSFKNKKWEEEPLKNNTNLQVGYYHILASDINEAVLIAKDNPDFFYNSDATIEIRPIKTKENTGFKYPTSY